MPSFDLTAVNRDMGMNLLADSRRRESCANLYSLKSADPPPGLQHDAALEGHKSWAELADKERAIFEDIARGG